MIPIHVLAILFQYRSIHEGIKYLAKVSPCIAPDLFTSPGVAGAVLQTPLLLIN